MPSGRGITRLETIVVAACVGLMFLFGLITLRTMTQRTSRNIGGAVNLRGLTQCFINWSNDNKGRFPLPSLADPQSHTVAKVGSAKNTTANIYSLLIWNWSLSPELLVDQREPSHRIDLDSDYAFKTPPAALHPELATWDPAFSADFTGATPGNVSYAHRRAMDWHPWSPNTPLVSSRGAEMIVLKPGDRPKFKIQPSLHLRNGSWEGGVGYDDTRVEWSNSAFITNDVTKITDAIFHDESAGQDPRDVFLGIFTTAGDAASDFTPIWD